MSGQSQDSQQPMQPTLQPPVQQPMQQQPEMQQPPLTNSQLMQQQYAQQQQRFAQQQAAARNQLAMREQPPAQVATEPSVPTLGLDGFCPVSLAEKKAWKRGDRRWGAVHNGVTYLFAGPEEQQRFLKSYDAYSPVCDGNDIVLLLTKGQTVAGTRQYGAFFSSHVFLFSCQETYDEFNKHPLKYVNDYARVIQARAMQQGRAVR